MLRGSISNCEVAAIGRLDRLVGGALAFLGTSAVVPMAGGTGEAAWGERRGSVKVMPNVVCSG